MTAHTCPQCGKLQTTESSDPCRCKTPPGNFLRGKTIEGPRFVRIILLVCVAVTLLAIGLFFLVVRLRVEHGLPGLD